jgi:hypothetical protein
MPLSCVVLHKEIEAESEQSTEYNNTGSLLITTNKEGQRDLDATY